MITRRPEETCGFDDMPLTPAERRWILHNSGATESRPPGRLRSKKLVEQVYPTMIYPPLYQLTAAGREMRDALQVQSALADGSGK